MRRPQRVRTPDLYVAVRLGAAGVYLYRHQRWLGYVVHLRLPVRSGEIGWQGLS